MKGVTLLIVFLMICSLCDSQDVTTSWKKAKKIAIKEDLKLKIAFAGPGIEGDIKKEILNGMQWLKFSDIKTNFANIGGSCDYCAILNSEISKMDGVRQYVYIPNSRIVECSAISGGENFSDLEDLQNRIVEDIIINKNSPKNIVIIVPAQSQEDLNILLQEGWSEEKPENIDKYEMRIVANCVNESMKLYKVKPCLKMEEIWFQWPNETTFWQQDESTKVVYPPSNPGSDDPMHYYFYSPNVCSQSLYLKFISTKDPGIVVNVLPIASKSFKGYYELIVNVDSSNLEELINYEIFISENNTTWKSMGNYIFIHCQK